MTQISWSTTMKRQASFPTSVRLKIFQSEISIQCSGKKYTKIQYDQSLYQWNISVANNPRISAVSYSDVSTMVIGTSSFPHHQDCKKLSHQVGAHKNAHCRKACVASEWRLCLQHSRPNCLPLTQVAFPWLTFAWIKLSTLNSQGLSIFFFKLLQL